VATPVVTGGFNQLLVYPLAGQVPISRAELVEDAPALFITLGDSAAIIGARRASPSPAPHQRHSARGE
jgi:hypothetical protein